MKKIIKSFLLLSAAALFTWSPAFAQQIQAIEKQTVMFSEKEGQELLLDYYSMAKDKQVKPCVMFMFGGGFMEGARDLPSYVDYFNFLVESGYRVVSIDYRLGYKDRKPDVDQGSLEGLMQAIKTFDMAVEDLLDATNFVLQNAGKWNIDPELIIACGSSAGAASSLMAEYYICNGHELSKKVPEGFNYAGIVSFAGAIFTVGDYKWDKQPCPVQLFQGDADRNMPYDNSVQMGAGFRGMKQIVDVLDAAGWPYYAYTGVNAGHELCHNPMRDNRLEILSFIENQVKGKKKEQVKVNVVTIGKAEVTKDFTPADYMRANFVEGFRPEL